MKRKHIVFLLPVVAILITLFIRFGIPAIRQQFQRGKIREGEMTESQLPENWEVSAESEKEVVLIRQEDKEIQTKMVLMKSETHVDDFSSYVDRLVRGAEQTLPSLEYSAQSDVETADGWQKIELVGFYFSGGDRINIIQEIYYQDSQLVTMTASYGEDGKEEIEIELNGVFDFLTETYL